jgi:hypothetical protein
MDTRRLHTALIAVAATLTASAAIASAAPTFVLERIAGPDAGERYAVGIEARAFCMRLVLDAEGHTVMIAAPTGCTYCRRLVA